MVAWILHQGLRQGRPFTLIDLKGIKWTSIGNMNDYEKQSTFFRGTFDKAGRTVSNLRYETDALTVGAEDFCGTLFARVRTAWAAPLVWGPKDPALLFYLETT